MIMCEAFRTPELIKSEANKFEFPSEGKEVKFDTVSEAAFKNDREKMDYAEFLQIKFLQEVQHSSRYYKYNF